MKVLIWVGCIFSLALILTLIASSGFILGGLPSVLLFGGMIFLAKTLCKQWDNRHAKTETKENTEEKTGENLVDNVDDNIDENK